MQHWLCDFEVSGADTFIQRTKRLYIDTRTQRNINKLNEDLTEVHSIMTKNIQDVLGQGEKLDSEHRPRQQTLLPYTRKPQVGTVEACARFSIAKVQQIFGLALQRRLRNARIEDIGGVVSVARRAKGMWLIRIIMLLSF